MNFFPPDVRRQPDGELYCRMWDTGFWAPVYKNWGWQNRTTTVRVAAGGRFEYRERRLVLQPLPHESRPVAGRARRRSSRTRPRPAATRATPTTCCARERTSKKVPDSLGAALDALAEDEVIRCAMPGRLYKVFNHYKRDEWERYLAAVTPTGSARSTSRSFPSAATPNGARRMRGIAGIIYENGNGEHRVGHDMTRMRSQ